MSKIDTLYKETVKDPSSKRRLVCIKAYKGEYQVGPGQIAHYSYKKGDVRPRNEIFLKPTHWKLT